MNNQNNYVVIDLVAFVGPEMDEVGLNNMLVLYLLPALLLELFLYVLQRRRVKLIADAL